MYSEAEMNNPVSFPRWAEALTSDLEVDPEQKDSCRRAILSYLKYLKDRRQRASFASAKAYFDEAVKNGRDSEEAREAVRWFFRAAKLEKTLNAERPTLNAEGETLNAEGGNCDRLWERYGRCETARLSLALQQIRLVSHGGRACAEPSSDRENAERSKGKKR